MTAATIVYPSGNFWKVHCPLISAPREYEYILQMLVRSAGRQFGNPEVLLKEYEFRGGYIVPMYVFGTMVAEAVTPNGYDEFIAALPSELTKRWYAGDRMFNILTSINETIETMRGMDNFGLAFWNGYAVI